ncbi:hypothetical protein BH23GEM3_BH23GEM3_15280 [soil metagenome]
MRNSIALLALVLGLAAAAPAAAQQIRTITPGMTVEEVRTAFGAPSVARDADGWTYFFYTNRCLPRCGTDDTVFFRDGRVVAAVLHAPGRRFAGPAAATALDGTAPAPPRERTGAVTEEPRGAAVSGIRIRLPDQAQPAADLGVVRGRQRAVIMMDTAVAAADTTVVAPPAGQLQERERRIEPNTIRTDTAAVPAPLRAPREQRIEANTIRRTTGQQPPPR